MKKLETVRAVKTSIRMRYGISLGGFIGREIDEEKCKEWFSYHDNYAYWTKWKTLRFVVRGKQLLKCPFIKEE